MHPPAFHLDHALSDRPDCTLELRCPCSPQMTLMPVRLLAERGDRPFHAVLAALRCSDCRGKPALAHLVAGHSRTFVGGAPPGWALELVPAPR